MAWNQAGNLRGPQGPQGVQGIQGQQGPSGVSGVTNRGPWSSTNSYAVNDLVTWGGSSYTASVAKTPGSAPPTGTSSDPGSDDLAVNSGWAPFAVQGAQGPQGVQGVQGTQGATGSTGPTGAQGVRGSKWFTGTGAPGTIAGSQADDQYLDLATGDVYTLS